MTTQQVAEKLKQMFHDNIPEDQIYDALFHPDARNVEAMKMPQREMVTQGVDKLKQKMKQRNETFEVLEQNHSEPTINDNQFIIQLTITTKNRHTQEQRKESEYVLYTVDNGKIIEEKFFYLPS